MNQKCKPKFGSIYRTGNARQIILGDCKAWIPGTNVLEKVCEPDCTQIASILVPECLASGNEICSTCEPSAVGDVFTIKGTDLHLLVLDIERSGVSGVLCDLTNSGFFKASGKVDIVKVQRSAIGPRIGTQKPVKLRYRVGDKVEVSGFGVGEIVDIDPTSISYAYAVHCEGVDLWVAESIEDCGCNCKDPYGRKNNCFYIK